MKDPVRYFFHFPVVSRRYSVFGYIIVCFIVCWLFINLIYKQDRKVYKQIKVWSFSKGEYRKLKVRGFAKAKSIHVKKEWVISNG